ncbi:MAG: hypothetical protein NTV87_16270 [Ignavibacteriae bacterium]|nr:hypothetical protein [Ignavibacteriota bacterium]
MNSLESYINNMKERLNQNLFSPVFIRLANLYYINDQFEECINICKIGLEIFPEYITPKIILMKALMKLEYINEAEKVIKEIEYKLPDHGMIENFRKCLADLKEKPKQEQIYYPGKISPAVSFKDYSELMDHIIINDSGIEFRELVNIFENKTQDNVLKENNEFAVFLKDFKGLALDSDTAVRIIQTKDKNPDILAYDADSVLSKIKIVTETIADLYAKQGMLKEAFDAYTILLRAGHKNKKRILDKLSELESMI